MAVVREIKPDVVLMNLRMPGTDGVEAVRRIRAERELDAVNMLVLTTFEDDHTSSEPYRQEPRVSSERTSDPQS